MSEFASESRSDQGISDGQPVLALDGLASEARFDVTELADRTTTEGGTAPSLPTDSFPDKTVEEIRLNSVLEEARLATGATGAAIALVKGAEIICCATSGPDAPDLGARLDPGSGLSGCCIQMRQLQQSSDTETDSRVDLGACRRLGVRSIVVLPIMDCGELFGIFEILSSRPDAFGRGDLETLQTLNDRILDRKRPQWNADPRAPRKDHVTESIQDELLTCEVFPASAQRNIGFLRSRYWMAIRTAAVVALFVVMGWMVGNARWRMAVDRADTQELRSQDEMQLPAQGAPDALPGSSSIEQPALTPSETALSEKEAGTLQTEGAQESAYVLVRVSPQYPEEAKRLHIQGRVVLKALVGTQGEVRRIVVTSGDPQLVDSAASAVRQWRFKPHRLKDRPVEFETQITVNFKLT